MTWRQWWCAWTHRASGHGTLVMRSDEVWLACPRCGWLSPGIEIDTTTIRLRWRYDRQRRRFKKAS